MVPTAVRRDRLISVRFVHPATIELNFADGRSFSLPATRIGMPVDRINWPTVAVPPVGETMTVNGIKGETIPVDATKLRYLVDATYAAEVDATLKSLQFSNDELERIVQDNPAPHEWYAQPSRDLISESWK